MAFNLQKVLKALLFSSSRPLSVGDIQDVFTRIHEQGALLTGTDPEATTTAGGPGDASAPAEGGPAESPAAAGAGAAPTDEEFWRDVPSFVTAAQIREALDEIARELRTADDVFLLTETAHGYRLVTQPQFACWVRALRNEVPPVKLSQSAQETLAVIAYRQPVTRAEIEHIRGVSAEAGINRLLERELIYIVGRADLPGRPIQYGTTDAFLDYVGIRSLDELPASDVLSRRQIDEWLQNAMKGTHPSDREMGLADEGEDQLSLDDAARAGAAPGGGAPRTEAEPQIPEASAAPSGPASPTELEAP